MRFSREHAFPSRDTFSVKPIGEMVRRYLGRSLCSVDPFARNCRWATHTNDLNSATLAEHHMDARDFLAYLAGLGVIADLVILDPPYSPTQIKRCYEEAGLKCGQVDTQNSVLYKDVRLQVGRITRPGSVALSFGWNTAGMGQGWSKEEVMLVCHGGAHNDTICMAERKL